MKKKLIRSTIETLSDQLIQNWPLYSFVTSNPLAGFEDLPFDEAIQKIGKNLNIRGYPSASQFKQLWLRNHIDADVITQKLKEANIDQTPAESLEQLASFEANNTSEDLLGGIDRHTIKWLSVFLDQGSSEWELPGKEQGFFTAWRHVVPFDPRVPHQDVLDSLSDDPLQALQKLLGSHEQKEVEAVFKHHLYALPGWTGYVLYRMESQNEWQRRYPITLTDYLAVRLTLCTLLDKPFLPEDAKERPNDASEDQLKLIWLKALEQSYQNKLISDLVDQPETSTADGDSTPEAQFVFCIDTRSERIRRAVEQSGPFQTFGYAGFFGVAMDYHHPEKQITHKACPPIVDSAFQATEQIQPHHKEQAERFNFYNTLHNALNEFRFTLKNNIPGSFGYVETAGLFYGVVILTKTLIPNFVYRLADKVQSFVGMPDHFSEVTLSHQAGEVHSDKQLSTGEKAEMAKTAFQLTGWDEFSRLVVFAGHGSQTANNPFGSSLDCGACSGNNGRHNARVLADICNDSEVRNLLAREYDIQIPEQTFFIAAEHNTTTNEITLFDDKAPAAYQKDIQTLKKQLEAATHKANAEQLGTGTENQGSHSYEAEAHRRAADWAETRPEWGLAGNASFIIGKRSLTGRANLEARSFLHHYDWEKDPDGDQLEAIFQGPMVVTQWINNHYYFATVDNEHFGSGTKITQNVTGKFGVVQGNGGDLKSGLPLESLQEDDQLLQHLPLRLTVLVQAPKSRVIDILTDNPNSLGSLITNQWIYLAVLDPTYNHQVTFLGREQLETSTP